MRKHNHIHTLGGPHKAHLIFENIKGL